MKFSFFRLFALAIMVSIPFVSISAFPDTVSYQWQKSIDVLEQKGVIEGYSDGTYQPDKNLNRAEFTKIVIESTYDDADFAEASADCFPDVKKTDWFSKYVCFAKSEGVIGGNPDGTFKPENTIVQAEALKIVLNAFYNNLPDAKEGEEWYQGFLDEADYMGMFYFDTKNAAAHQVTRGEMAYFVAWNLDENLEDQISYEDFAGIESINKDIFGFEPMLASQCSADQKYDAEEKYCYDACEDDNSCGTDQAKLDEWFDDWDKEPSEVASDEEIEKVNVIYTVNADTITYKETTGTPSIEVGTTWEDRDLHQKTWERVVKVIPTELRKNIKEFHIFTDGLSNTDAFVKPIGDYKNGNWVVAVDILDADHGSTKEAGPFALVIVHEFAHALTLNTDQMKADIEVDNSEDDDFCAPTVTLQEGCAKEDSFINIYFKKFWGKTMMQQARKSEADKSGALYTSEPDSFVTEYAATSISEDIAESFSYFVMKDKPVGTSIKDKKVLFFYEFPSLIQLRSQIRNSVN